MLGGTSKSTRKHEETRGNTESPLFSPVSRQTRAFFPPDLLGPRRAGPMHPPRDLCRWVGAVVLPASGGRLFPPLLAPRALPRFVINRQLATRAGLSEAPFRARVARGQALRSRDAVELNLWTSTPKRLLFLTRVHTAVHADTFDARLTELGLSPSQVPVVRALPAPLWPWPRAHTRGPVHALVTNWMAAHYAANHGRHAPLPAWKPAIKTLAASRYPPLRPGPRGCPPPDVGRRVRPRAATAHARAARRRLNQPLCAPRRAFAARARPGRTLPLFPAGRLLQPGGLAHRRGPGPHTTQTPVPNQGRGPIKGPAAARRDDRPPPRRTLLGLMARVDAPRCRGLTPAPGVP